jgi:hypothetical protein
MPDFSSPQSCIKPYENRHGRLIKTPLLPTLKPEEPIMAIRLQQRPPPHHATSGLSGCRSTLPNKKTFLLITGSQIVSKVAFIPPIPVSISEISAHCNR